LGGVDLFKFHLMVSFKGGGMTDLDPWKGMEKGSGNPKQSGGRSPPGTRKGLPTYALLREGACTSTEVLKCQKEEKKRIE